MNAIYRKEGSNTRCYCCKRGKSPLTCDPKTPPSNALPYRHPFEVVVRFSFAACTIETR